MTRKDKNLTDEDHKLWTFITRKIRPLTAEKHAVVKTRPTQAPSVPSPERVPVIPAVSGAIPFSPDLLSPGLPSLPSRKIQRVRKVTLDARLDLHGLNHQQAKRQLIHFLYLSQNRKCLWVLVITGKSRRTDKKQDTEANYPLTRRQTLRELVPQWLEDPLLKPVVAAYAGARPNDGGEGALYVRLKRRVQK